MVGALWIDSGSDSDGDARNDSHRHQRRSQESNAVAGPSRAAATQPRKPPRRAVAPPSSSSSVVLLSSSQDHDQPIAAKIVRSRTVSNESHDAPNRKQARHSAETSQPTPVTRVARLLANPSPDTSLPSFRDMLSKHKSRSAATATRDQETTTTFMVANSCAAAPISSRSGSLRRTVSQPTASSSQDSTSSRPANLIRRAKHAAMPEVIEIGSDSIVDPASQHEAADAPLFLQGSSPIRSQFSARQQLSSSQPLPFSPPKKRSRDAVAQEEEKKKEFQRKARQAYRAESAPIVILSSSPPPPASFPRASQGVAGAIEDTIAEEELELPDLPPSSFPFDACAPPSPPSSPPTGNQEEAALDTSPSLKRRAAAGTSSKLPSPKRARGFHRTTSLLDALDSLYVPDNDTSMPDLTTKNGPSSGLDRTTSAAAVLEQGSNAADTPSASPSKTKKAAQAAAAKEAREAKAREREAAKATKLRLAAEKKRFAEANRLRTSKSDTMREMIIDLDRTLFASGQPLAGRQDSITARFEEEGATVHLCDGVVAPPLVRFRRKVRAEWSKERRHWVPLDREEVKREAVAVVVMDGGEVVRLVSEGGEGGLEGWYKDLKRRLGAVNGEEEGQQKVFLICQGLVKYYSRLRASENRAYTARIRQQLANEGQPDDTASAGTETASKSKRKAPEAPSLADLPAQPLVETALLHLKLIHRCFVIHASSLVDSIEWLHQLSSDLSLRPYKSLRDTHLSFAVDTGRNTTSSSSPAIWSMMLQQIPRVTPAIASSIQTIYPSLHSLVEAYEKCRDEKEERALLSGVQVESNKDGTERRGNRMNLGLQLSKRIHTVLRGTNAEVLINNPTKD